MLRAGLEIRIGAAFIAAFGASEVLAQKPGDLIVTPTRVTLDAKNKAGNLTLVNRGTQPVRYRLRFVDMIMREDGSLQRTSVKPATSGADYFKLSPREVFLQPGESQRIKVLAAFPLDARPGEYRSHLSFEPILGPRRSSSSIGNPQTLSIQLDLRMVITIPVIASNGPVSGAALMSDAVTIKEGENWIAQFVLSRAGNKTVRGDVSIQFIPAAGGARISLGEISGLPIYYPNQRRLVRVKLTKDVSKLGNGQIEIQFTDPDRPRGSPVLRTVAKITT